MSTATWLDQIIETLVADAALLPDELATITVCRKTIQDGQSLIEKARTAPGTLTTKDKIDLMGLSNAQGRIRSVREAAFNRIFDIEK